MSNFIDVISQYAIKIGNENNILPSLIIAQAIVESASGTSELAVKANNFFGIKKGSGWLGETYFKRTSEQTKDGNVFYIEAEFRKYSSIQECISDLCYKYTHGTGWENFNRYEKIVGEKDYKKATQVLVDSKYASDIKYALKLNDVIEKYGLTKFDYKEEVKKMFKVAVCAGHAGFGVTAGKRSPNGEYEWDFNNKVVLAFIEEMNKYENVEVRRFDDPTGKTDVPLKTRTDLANAWGADIYISFHHNASKNVWGDWTGVETYTYLGSNPKSEKLAKLVHPHVVKAYGLKDRGIKKGDYHIVRETKMPSVLIEGGFMDSLIDIKKLRDNNVLKDAGIGVAVGVAEYASLTKKPIVAPAPPQGKVMWGKTELKKGQIGKITILKPINLWRRDENNKLHFVRVLNPNEEYRVYGFDNLHGGQYDVGARHYITKMDGYIKYETPSKAKLEELARLHGEV